MPAILGVRRSIVGFELMDRGDRSTERRKLCMGEGESDSDLATPLLSLLTLGVAGDGLPGVSDKLLTLGVAVDDFPGVSDKPDLFKFQYIIVRLSHKNIIFH